MPKLIGWALAALIGYALGCVSTGIIVSRLYGKIDIRDYGSGNVGMTNVMRTLGWVPSFLTFAGDALKGVAGALIGRLVGGEIGLHVGGLFAVIGHNWPAPLRFRGGKGMSTSFGYVLAADWRLAIILLGLQTGILLITGYMSLASIVSSIALVALAFVFKEGGMMIVVCAILCALALYSHRENIIRLINGNENRLNGRKITDVSRKSVEKIKNRRKNRHEQNSRRS